MFSRQPCGAGGGLEAVCTGKQYGETAGVEVEFGRAEAFVFDDFARVLLLLDDDFVGASVAVKVAAGLLDGFPCGGGGGETGEQG